MKNIPTGPKNQHQMENGQVETSFLFKSDISKI
jgi:hypothetical protein